MEVPPCPNTYALSWVMRGGTYYLACASAPIELSSDDSAAESSIFFLQFVGVFLLIFFTCSIIYGCCINEDDSNRRYARSIQRF